MDIEIKISDDGFQAKYRLTDIPYNMYKGPELYCVTYTLKVPIRCLDFASGQNLVNKQKAFFGEFFWGGPNIFFFIMLHIYM